MSYAELHCKTNFSFLEGASHPDELVGRAAELGYAALAVTDRNSLAGVVRAHVAAKQAGLKLIVGAELTPDDAPAVVLWAPDRPAYGRLSRLITCGRRRAAKGECRLELDDLARCQAGLLAGVQVPFQRDLTAWQRPLEIYRELFGDRGYLLAELHRGPDDQARLDQLLALSRKTRLPLVAAQDAHYHVPARLVLHDVLTAIRHGLTVGEAGERLFPNAQRHLKPLAELTALFARVPQALRQAAEIADRCTFSLDQLRYEYPQELVPAGTTPAEYLARLTWQGARQRYPGGVPAKVQRLLEHELKLIEELHYEAYFLTVWDLVHFARSGGILCQGRGSAANSAVCFCLGITAVDPDRSDVLFERFISRQRDEAPDIDVDFEHQRREEVLQYVYAKYGRQRAGMTAVVITYRCRSAVRDVGKALGLSLDRVDALAKQVEGYDFEPRLAERCRQVGIDPESATGQRLLYLVDQLIGFPRHLSQHVGGMVITRGPLCELAPLENAAMPGRTVIQWDKDDLEELGILKVDCLALGMLTAIHQCFGLIQDHYGRQWTLATVPADDRPVYDMICRADTIGVFQIESRAQMSMLPRLQPRCYYDLVIEVAIVRPGPIQGQMVHPYLRRRAGQEAVHYPNPAIRRVLEKTLGVPLFQEQAMRLAVVAAGFTPGEADQLRRAMGAWRRPGLVGRFRQKLLQGMRQQGLPARFAEQVFRQIRGFGEYGFPESHAASFALLVYVSAWLKCYYPAAFTAALLNSQPLGFYAPAQLIRDARQHGVPIRPADVNHSHWQCTLESGQPDAPARGAQPDPPHSEAVPGQKPDAQTSGEAESGQPDAPARGAQPDPPHSEAVPGQVFAIRLGLRMLAGLGPTEAAAIERARAAGPFGSLEDFSRRTGLSRKAIRRLAEADAFLSLGHDRRQAMWEALAQGPVQKSLPLLDNLPPEQETPAALPPLELEEQVLADYQTSGLSLRAHPLSFYRQQLDRLGALPAAKLDTVDHNRSVCVAGLVLLRQRPGTAGGITFATLEDETGLVNLVIRPAVWQRDYQVARRSAAWLAHGKLQHKDSVIHVVVHRLEDLSGRLKTLGVRSRDFR